MGLWCNSYQDLLNYAINYLIGMDKFLSLEQNPASVKYYGMSNTKMIFLCY